jgi:hypothetical protein
MYCQATGQPRVEIFAASPTRFFLKVVDGELEFSTDEKGVWNKLLLDQGGHQLMGIRVK